MTHTLSKYLTELSMPEYTMLRFSPSTIAAAAVFLARKMTGKSPTWVRERKQSLSSRRSLAHARPVAFNYRTRRFSTTLSMRLAT